MTGDRGELFAGDALIWQKLLHFAARKGARYRSSERIGIMGAVPDLEPILQSLLEPGSMRNAGILPRFAVNSEKKLLLQTVWRRERDSNTLALLEARKLHIPLNA
jgi:hypothetical protein